MPVTEAISESVQVPSGEPQDVASSSGMAIELLTPGSADTSALITLLILSVFLTQLVAEAINVNIVLRLVIGPHAIVVQVFLKQFLALTKNVTPRCFRTQLLLKMQ